MVSRFGPLRHGGRQPFPWVDLGGQAVALRVRASFPFKRISPKNLRFVSPALAVSLPCLAADNPWNGTPKLNPDKSKMTGGGKMTVNTGAMTLHFPCDGKVLEEDHFVLSPDGQTITLTAAQTGQPGK